MDFKICLTIFGIITLTNGKPAKDDSTFIVTNENELQQLLKSLNAGDGNIDIAFSHHEDGPKSHHEDKTHFFRHPDAHEAQRHSHKHKSHHDSHHHAEEHPSLTNIQTLNLFLKKKPHNAEVNDDDASSSDDDVGNLLGGLRNKNAGRGFGNVNEVISLLKNLGRSGANNNKADDRCAGGMCAIGRSADNNDRNNDDNRDDDDDDDDDDDSKNNNNRNDNNKNDRDDCKNGKCGVNRDDNDLNNFFDRNNGNNLHCFGGVCSKTFRIFDDNSDNYYNNINRADDDRDDNNDAQCNGDRCDADQNNLRERRLPAGDTHIQHLFKPQTQKFKINDDLDAIVVDVSDLSKIFGNPQSYGQGKDENEVHVIEDFEYDNTQGSNRNSESKLNPESNIEAVVVDLSKSSNDLAKEIKGLVSKLQGSLKRKPVQTESVKKERLLGDSKILPHNEENNNVYVPKWLLEEVISRSNVRESEKSLKRLLPLTAKQKERMMKALAEKNKTSTPTSVKRVFRRSIQDDVGVPFHLEIQGLGQVNP